MLFRVTPVLLLTTIGPFMLGAHLSIKDTGTVIAVPMIAQRYNYCDTMYYSDHSSLDYGIVISSQKQYEDRITPTMQMLGSHGSQCNRCACPAGITTEAIHYREMILLDLTNECYNQSGYCQEFSLQKQCGKRSIIGMHILFYGNPTFTAIVIAITSLFQQSLAIYPNIVPIASKKQVYIYYIIHSRHSTMTKGITLQNPSLETDANISMKLTNSAFGLKNGNMSKIYLASHHSMINFLCGEVLWIEPIESNQESKNLSGTVVYSTSPINVFTNLLRSDKDDIIYSQIAHQMPEKERWGRIFILDMIHNKLIPEEIKSHLIYEITVISYIPNSTVTMKFDQVINFAIRKSNFHYLWRGMYNQTQMMNLSHIEINSISPLLVIFETYTTTVTSNNSVHYSVLAQPVEWYANKQTVLLAHPIQHIIYQYHISIFVPTNDSNLADILESDGGLCNQGLPISNYNVLRNNTSFNYTMLSYKRFFINSTNNQTQLLLYHSNPHVQIGVTVYAYSETLHYSYSNGYTLGYPGDEDYCSRATTPSPSSSTSGSHLIVTICCSASIGLAALTITIAFVVFCVTKRHKVPYKPIEQNGPSQEYCYDVFIMCADEDDDFAKCYIEEPLKESGYSVLRKETAPHGLFLVGNAVISDIDQIMSLCSQMIVICSENYNTDAGNDIYNLEICYCKEMASRNSRIIPVILDEINEPNFAKFTQHRVQSAEILSSWNSRHAFIQRLKRNINAIN